MTDLEEVARQFVAMMSDEKLIQWGHSLGIELTERDQLLDAAAVGFTVMAWRNTSLEDIHAGGGRLTDTVMMRANIATACQVRDVLDDLLPEGVTVPGEVLVEQGQLPSVIVELGALLN